MCASCTVLAGGCASRTVVRFGAGSLKSFIVFIVMGLVGYMTARGLLYYVRTAVETAPKVSLQR